MLGLPGLVLVVACCSSYVLLHPQTPPAARCEGWGLDQNTRVWGVPVGPCRRQEPGPCSPMGWKEPPEAQNSLRLGGALDLGLGGLCSPVPISGLPLALAAWALCLPFHLDGSRGLQSEGPEAMGTARGATGGRSPGFLSPASEGGRGGGSAVV